MPLDIIELALSVPASPSPWDDHRPNPPQRRGWLGIGPSLANEAGGRRLLAWTGVADGAPSCNSVRGTVVRGPRNRPTRSGVRWTPRAGFRVPTVAELVVEEGEPSLSAWAR